MAKLTWRTPLFVLFRLLLLIEALLKALILPSKPKARSRPYLPTDYYRRSTDYRRPTGYSWRGEDGKWHTRWWVYNDPPAH